MSDRDEQPEPVASVIIPTYDRPSFLVDALDSVCCQSYEPIEIIIIDDASPESAESQVAEHIPDAIDWRYIRHSRNRGANAARNTGISVAKGEFIAFLDDDDRWETNKLELQIAALESPQRQAGVCLVGQRFVDERGSTTFIKRPGLSGNVTRELLAGAVAGPFSTIMVRSSVIKHAGLPTESLPSLQDRDWLLTLSEHTPFVSIGSPLMYRRSGSYGQIGDQYVAKRDQTYPFFMSNYRETAQTYGVEPAFLAWLHSSVAGSALRAGEYRDAIQFSLRALQSNPVYRDAWTYLFASLGGDFTYRPARGLKRRMTGGITT